jgi:hypothetical protein
LVVRRRPTFMNSNIASRISLLSRVRKSYMACKEEETRHLA